MIEFKITIADNKKKNRSSILFALNTADDNPTSDEVLVGHVTQDALAKLINLLDSTFGESRYVRFDGDSDAGKHCGRKLRRKCGLK